MVTIRRYAPTDHQAVWDLHNTALRAVGTHIGDGPWDDDLNHIDAEYLDAAGLYPDRSGPGGSVHHAVLREGGSVTTIFA
jgi:hypothetical protein